MMKSYKKKISELNECSFRMGDKDILPALINIWWSIPEESLTDEHKKRIDSYYYRYRRQVLDPNDKDKKRICKLDYWDFHREVNGMSNTDTAPCPPPQKEVGEYVSHASRGEWERRKRVMQLTIFN